MNREILFRGFHEDIMGSKTIIIDGKEFQGEWIYGYYWLNTIQRAYITTADGDMYAVIPSTVGQYTGLDDKNGKKIFEGDRCIYNSCYKNIDYEFYKGAVKFGEYYQDGSGDEYAPCEVIGFYLKRQSAHLGRLAFERMTPYEPGYLGEDTIFKDYIEVIGTIFDKE